MPCLEGSPLSKGPPVRGKGNLCAGGGTIKGGEGPRKDVGGGIEGLRSLV